MRWPSCQAIWLADGTGRISRSASDRSLRYIGTMCCVEVRAILMASRAVMRAPGEADVGRVSLWERPRRAYLIERQSPRSSLPSPACRFRGRRGGALEHMSDPRAGLFQHLQVLGHDPGEIGPEHHRDDLEGQLFEIDIAWQFARVACLPQCTDKLPYPRLL